MSLGSGPTEALKRVRRPVANGLLCKGGEVSARAEKTSHTAAEATMAPIRGVIATLIVSKSLRKVTAPAI